jgi:hypothetical protein
MAIANTLAYYVTATITAVKSFIVQAPGQYHIYLVLSDGHKSFMNSMPFVDVVQHLFFFVTDARTK